MGRFFQAQPLELSKDNIYQPPLELMMAMLDKQNSEVQQTGDNAQKLLDSLDFNYDAIDSDNAKNIIKEVSDKVNNATDIFNKDLSSPEARRTLNSLKDEIKSRYTSGDIYNIQQTDANKKAFEQTMDDAKLSELDKERHRTYFNNWAKDNPDGSLKNFFTPGNIVEDEDYVSKAITAFKLIDPTQKKSMIDNLAKAGYITKNTRDVEGVVREHFLKDYVESNPDIKSGILNRQQSGLYQDYDIQTNDDGSLNYEQGLLKQQSDLLKNYNYTKTTTGKDYQADSMWQYQDSVRREEAAAKAAQDESNAYGDVGYKTKFQTLPEIVANNTQFNSVMDNYRERLGLPKVDLNNASKILNGNDVGKQITSLIKKYRSSDNPEDKRRFQFAQKLALQFNKDRNLYEGANTKNNWTELSRTIGNKETQGIRAEFELRNKNIAYYNGLKDVVIMDEEGKRVNLKGESLQEFMRKNDDFFAVDGMKGEFDAKKQQEEHYVDNSLGPLVNKGDIGLSRTEYKMQGKSGKVYRVSNTFKQVFPDINYNN